MHEDNDDEVMTKEERRVTIPEDDPNMYVWTSGLDKVQLLQTSEKALKRSDYLHNTILDEEHVEKAIAVPNKYVPEKYLQKCIDYLNMYEIGEPPEIESPLIKKLSESIPQRDYDFINVGKADAMGILQAANYLGIAPLVELASAYVSEFYNSKSAEQLRAIFAIHNDFSSEEKVHIDQILSRTRQ
jgi:hypothetical protein